MTKRVLMKKIVLLIWSVMGIFSVSHAQWINPSSQSCTQNYGILSQDGGCQSNWYSAKKICSSMGARLPSKDEFKELVNSCGGDSKNFKNNKNNAQYQSCLASKSLVTSGYYWSETFYSVRLASPWLANFLTGYKNDYGNTNGYLVTCVN